MMRLLRTGLNMEYVVYLLVLCLEMTLYAFVEGGDVVSPSGYLWKTGDWGKCQGAPCGFGGTQSRVTWCEHIEGWTAQDSDCDLMSMPQSERTCFKVCAEHAELFEWQVESWGPCEQNEEDLIDILIDSPTGTDQTCGERSLGKQYRKVKCVEKSTSYVQGPHESFVSNEVCKELHPEPQISQECITPCAQDCVVTQFTPWTICTSTCGNGTQTQTRRVVIPPSRGGKTCPALSESRFCTDIPLCNGEQQYTYSVKIGPWSECERFQPEDPEEEFGGSPGSGIPLLGMQNREVWCIQSDGTEVKFKKCLSSDAGITIPPRYQACVMSQDCTVTEWSDWTSCPVTCPLPYGMASQERPQTKRTRRRHVQMLPLGAGELCPKLEEEQPCQIEEGVGISSQDCPRYTWHTGGWSECKVSAVMSQHDAVEFANNSTLCGGGLHKRHVYCIELNDTELIPVANDLCEASSKLPMTEECNVECPKDCKVTEWGPWSQCKTTSCSTQTYKREKGHKMRTRDVTVTPDIGGKTCPHLAEFVPCDIHMCYDWHSEPAGECVLSNSQESCGAGTKQQKVICVGPDKEPVSDHLCTGVSLEKPAAQQPCSLPCPDDCVITEWSAWTECSQSCGKGGSQTRRRTILARNKPGSRDCPPDKDLTETRFCNTHSCVVFAWLTTDWTSCQSVNTAPSYHIPKHLIEGITCGIGRQTRTLNCVRVRKQKITPQLTRCSDLNKPPVSQQCKIPCPKDCEVSEWGQWSACPESCPEGEKNVRENFYRTRQRYIINHPRDGGTHCPQQEEREPCLIPEHCFEYEWLESNWGLCKPVSETNGLPEENEDGQQCGKGLKTREINCQRSDGYPFSIDMCLKYAGPMPGASEPCNLLCDDDCTFKEWGRWTSCPSNCDGDQIRRRKLIGKSRKETKCKDLVLYPEMERRLCTCPSFDLVPTGSESDCILGQNTAMVSAECGFGLTRRALQCQDEQGRIMPFSYCNSEREFLESVCEVPCPYDCNLSPWSVWSDCSQVEGVGQRTRRRQIKNIEDGPRTIGNGRPCPAHDGEGYLYETKPCQVFNDTTVDYYWSSEQWQECHLDVATMAENATCGFGFQRRTVRCILKSPAGFMAWTNHTMCDLDIKSLETRECRKPCPGDCVVTDWTKWSNCPSNCHLISFRHRTREIIRQPPGNDASLCPDLMEREQCQLGTNCIEYVWNVTGWSTCELKPGAVCGEGSMTRILQCKELQEGSSANVVDMSYCEERLPSYGEPLEVSCGVGCSMDCLLSEWAEWTKCSDVCGPDVGQIRTRKVLREASVLGRPCSTERQQKRPCKAMPCFQWVVSEWTDCYTLNGDCGMGIQTRNLSCVQNDGVVVEDSFCIGNKPYSSNFNVTFIGNELLERSHRCTIPCPGECQYTQWSPWSKCHIYCHEGRPIGSEGVEARSKAALESYKGASCPGDDIDTRPCIGNTCYRFTWQMGSWTLGHRDVWCQRSDSLNVTGACSGDEKPNPDARCEPLCLVKHSFCSQHKVCTCMKDYDPKYSTETGHLEKCEEAAWISDPGIPYTEVPETSGDDERRGGGKDDKTIDISEGNKEKSEGEAEKNVFGAIPVWAFAVGGVFIVFILCLITASCCACRSCRKKEEPKKKEPTDDFAIYWDETAKKRYNGEVDL